MTCFSKNIQPKENIRQLKNELIFYKASANYWEANSKKNIKIREELKKEYKTKINQLNQKYILKEKELLEEIEKLQIKIKLRERQLFVKKSEKRSKKEFYKKLSKRTRGQQKGKRSPKKRKYYHLEKKEEIISLENPICPHCKLPFSEINSTEDSEIIEIEVKPHIRKIRRKKYRCNCNCGSPIIIASKESKLIPKSNFGASIWIELLLEKYWFCNPLNRTLKKFESYNLSIATSTIISGFMTLYPFLEKIYKKIYKKSLQDKMWNIDESGWKVFEDKKNNKWILWVMKSASAVTFTLDPGRGAKVLNKYFQTKSTGKIICDRYSSYKSFAKNNKNFKLAYCWAHVRRDFFALMKDNSKHSSWAGKWFKKINQIYHLNNLRIKNKKKFFKNNEKLKIAINSFHINFEKELKKELSEPRLKLLKSLKNHWEGLYLFFKNSKIPMDNNSAERALRNPIVGRKNYYGSGSIKSGYFSAIMFSIIQTLLQWNINPKIWFKKVFEIYANSKNDIFVDIDKFLPWNISSDEMKEFYLKNNEPP